MADEQAVVGQQEQQATYTPPASQADLDKIIADRLSRERAKFADYADLQKKASEYDKAQESAKSELQKAVERAEAAEKKVTGYETRDQASAWAKEIVKDSKVPADALRGSTKEELQAHFEQLSALIPKESTTTPKGAVGPYVPGEGAATAGTLGGPAQEFADWFQGQLGQTKS